MALWISALWLACASDESETGLDDSGVQNIDTADTAEVDSVQR